MPRIGEPVEREQPGLAETLRNTVFAALPLALAISVFGAGSSWFCSECSGPVVAEPRILAAAFEALLVTPLRSLPICLAAGVAAFVLAGLFA